MLAIRMQRIGRRGRAHFRVVVQDSRWSPKSGKFVAMLGNYDPQSKAVNLAKDKAQAYLNNGAQPSERVAKLLKSEGVKLPDWVPAPTKKAGKPKNPEKLRKNQPKDAKPVAETPAAEPTEPNESTDSQQPQTAVEAETEAVVEDGAKPEPSEVEPEVVPVQAKDEPTEEPKT